MVNESKVEEFKAEASNFKEVFTPGPSKRKRLLEEEELSEEWLGWIKNQRSLTSGGRELIRSEGGKGDPSYERLGSNNG